MDRRRPLTLLAACAVLASLAACGSTPEDAIDTELDRFGLRDSSATRVIDTLDATNDDRESPLRASVRPDSLVLTVGDQERTLAMPKDRTYLSIAPFREQTHDCFNHNLTTCQGEQVKKSFTVTLTDAQGRTVVDEKATTWDNGFLGLWVPRDVTGTLTVSGEAGSGSIPVSTDANAPTCLTTVKLS